MLQKELLHLPTGRNRLIEIDSRHRHTFIALQVEGGEESK